MHVEEYGHDMSWQDRHDRFQFRHAPSVLRHAQDISFAKNQTT